MATDKILINGLIYTENPDMPWAEALGFDGKIISFVGDKKGAEALIAENPDAEIVDLEGKTVIPGFIEGHNHPPLVARTYWHLTGPLTYDKDELLENIREYAAKYTKEEYPYFYYNNYMTETFGEEGPTKEFFDQAINDRPARIQDFGDHACCYNSMALEMLKDENGIPHSSGITDEAIFKKNADGEYTGHCLESVYTGDVGVYESIGWYPETIINDKMIGPLFDYYKEHGIMCVMDAMATEEDNIKYIYELDKAGKLDMFYDFCIFLINVANIDQTIETLRYYEKNYTTDHIRFNVVKYFIDGTNEIGDCLSLEPFYNDPTGTNYGYATATMEEMRDVMVRLNKEKLDFHVHTRCDGAFRRMLDAVEAAQNICGDDWCIKVTLTHCELIHEDDIPRARDLGVYIDSSLHWHGGYFGDAATIYLGKDRWNEMQAFRKAIDGGIKVGFSSDTFVYAEASRCDPMVGMQIGITRVDPEFPLNPDKYPGSVKPPYDAGLKPEEILHGYMSVNAERMRLDDKMGSLEVGKLANIVVYKDNIFEIANKEPEHLGRINPECTYFEGRKRQVVSTLKKGPKLVK